MLLFFNSENSLNLPNTTRDPVSSFVATSSAIFSPFINTEAPENGIIVISSVSSACIFRGDPSSCTGAKVE